MKAEYILELMDEWEREGVTKGKMIERQFMDMYAEYTILKNYFGAESMSIWFNNYRGYQDAREKATYQQVFEVLNQNK